MAKQEAQPTPESTETPAPPSRKKKIIILSVAALLIFALVGGGVLFFVKHSKKNTEANPEEEEIAEAAEEKKKEEKKKTPPVFSNLETFTVNLVRENAEQSSDQYLQVAITVELEDPAADAAFKANMPKIRDTIIRLLGSKKASELATTEGKDELAAELKDDMNLLLEPPPTAPKKKPGKKKKNVIEGPVKAVLFTAFIIQ